MDCLICGVYGVLHCCQSLNIVGSYCRDQLWGSKLGSARELVGFFFVVQPCVYNCHCILIMFEIKIGFPLCFFWRISCFLSRWVILEQLCVGWARWEFFASIFMIVFCHVLYTIYRVHCCVYLDYICLTNVSLFCKLVNVSLISRSQSGTLAPVE